MTTATTQQSTRPKAHALFKLNFCLRMAKENSLSARTEPHRYRPEYRRMRRSRCRMPVTGVPYVAA